MTDGGGMGMGRPGTFRSSGRLPGGADDDALPGVGGICEVLAGSCSRATVGQVGRVGPANPDQ